MQIKETNLSNQDIVTSPKSFADAIVLTADGKFLIQYRPPEWWTSPNTLNTFGGHIDNGETPIQALMRELNEELGADVIPDEPIFLGCILEESTNFSEPVFMHFWYDKRNTIKGCFEAQSRHFDSIDEIIDNPLSLPHLKWGLKKIKELGITF